jgi:hypothetical protein
MERTTDKIVWTDSNKKSAQTVEQFENIKPQKPLEINIDIPKPSTIYDTLPTTEESASAFLNGKTRHYKNGFNEPSEINQKNENSELNPFDDILKIIIGLLIIGGAGYVCWLVWNM